MKSKRHRAARTTPAASQSGGQEGGGEALQRGEKARREPVFPISRQEIIQRCRAKPHDMLCAGEALALMDLMIHFHLTIKKLHELTHVARSMIHDILCMEAVTTNDTVAKLGRPFGMQAIEFHLLGFFTLRAEVSP
ncbi:MAG: hypothetical protein ACKVY0_03205 [Prosthecobacter sp.]|uniref:hypothetical protein n=1 Tax=Prosthecobacter sp. TaxID=1965333 RepID=UPI003902F7AF